MSIVVSHSLNASVHIGRKYLLYLLAYQRNNLIFNIVNAAGILPSAQYKNDSITKYID